MRSRSDGYIDFESFGQRAKQLDSDGEAYQCGHAAVRYSRCELHINFITFVVYLKLEILQLFDQSIDRSISC